MNELLLYAFLFLALITHCLLAGKMYRTVHQDTGLTFKAKNDWKLKALIFPGLYWFYYKNEKRRQNS
jgi:hypothetical protein